MDSNLWDELLTKAYYKALAMAPLSDVLAFDGGPQPYDPEEFLPLLEAALVEWWSGRWPRDRRAPASLR